MFSSFVHCSVGSILDSHGLLPSTVISHPCMFQESYSGCPISYCTISETYRLILEKKSDTNKSLVLVENFVEKMLLLQTSLVKQC